MNNSGKASFSSFIAEMTGPVGSLAEVPQESLVPGANGTPKRITDFKPFATKGVRKGISLFRPRRDWFGREEIGVSSSGLSVMKRG